MPGAHVAGQSRLAARARLMDHGLSPAMDAALLVVPPPPPAAGAVPATTPAMPANMSVAQRRMREMLMRRQAARTGGAAASQASGGLNAEPARGAPVRLELWRLAPVCVRLWDVECPRPSIFTPSASTVPEREDCTILGIVWSPNGASRTLLAFQPDI